MRRIVDGRAVSGYGDGALGAATIGVTPGEEYSRIQKDGGGTRGGYTRRGRRSFQNRGSNYLI